MKKYIVFFFILLFIPISFTEAEKNCIYTDENGHRVIGRVEEDGSTTPFEECEEEEHETRKASKNKEQDFSINYGGLALNILLTFVAYTIIPFIIKFSKIKVNNRRLCIINSIVVGFVFLLITVNKYGKWSPITAFFYYYINSTFILKD